jgi:hypothetical protein
VVTTKFLKFSFNKILLVFPYSVFRVGFLMFNWHKRLTPGLLKWFRFPLLSSMMMFVIQKTVRHHLIVLSSLSDSLLGRRQERDLHKLRLQYSSSPDLITFAGHSSIERFFLCFPVLTVRTGLTYENMSQFI